MSEDKKSLLIKYGAGFGTCAVVAAYYAFSNHVLYLSYADQMRILSDAFSIPGLLSILGALYCFVSNGGAFLGIGYALSYAVKVLIPMAGTKVETYASYRERKADKKIEGYGFLYVVGFVFLAISAVFTFLHSQTML